MSANPASAPQAATPFYKSKAFYGIVLTFALPIARKYFHFTDIDTDTLADILVQIATGASALFALFGRAKATGPLTLNATNAAKPIQPTE